MADITPEMLDQAAREENEHLSRSPEVIASQNQYLNQRVVLLRALVNQQKTEIEELKGQAESAELVTEEGAPTES